MNVLHCFVTGRVQGVFFRASTEKEAVQLGLDGWVRNLRDGRVEVFAQGDARSLETLRQWLEIGPDYAHVERLECISDEEPRNLSPGFRIIA